MIFSLLSYFSSHFFGTCGKLKGLNGGNTGPGIGGGCIPPDGKNIEGIFYNSGLGGGGRI